MWSWQATEREEVGRSKTGTASFAEFSKLTAKMVELSLQEAQRQRTLRGPVPDKLSAVPSPLLWPSTDVQRTPERPAESAGRPGTGAAATPLTRPQAHGTPGGLRIANFAVLYSRATIILREMTNYWNEVPRHIGLLARKATNHWFRCCWKSARLLEVSAEKSEARDISSTHSPSHNRGAAHRTHPATHCAFHRTLE